MTDIRASEPEPTTWRRLMTLPFVLITLAAVFVVVGVVFEIRHHQTSASAPTNTAIVDSATTNQVISQVSSSLNTVLSYNYRNPTPTQQAAARDLTGDAAGQYTTLFSALKAKAPGQQLTLVAKVLDAGVVSLHGDSAQLLVFLDQSSTRASDKATSASAAQIMISAVRQQGQWKISEIVPL